MGRSAACGAAASNAVSLQPSTARAALRGRGGGGARAGPGACGRRPRSRASVAPWQPPPPARRRANAPEGLLGPIPGGRGATDRRDARGPVAPRLRPPTGPRPRPHLSWSTADSAACGIKRGSKRALARGGALATATGRAGRGCWGGCVCLLPGAPGYGGGSCAAAGSYQAAALMMIASSGQTGTPPARHLPAIAPTRAPGRRPCAR
jgi:hypothetical protein